MNEIVVLDLVNNERNTFGSVDKAEKWILNNYIDEVEGLHPDIESVQILQVLKQVEVEELDNKKHKISFVPVELPVKPAIGDVIKIMKVKKNTEEKSKAQDVSLNNLVIPQPITFLQKSDIAIEANKQKRELFKQYRWKMNHRITEGDIAIVIDAIKNTSKSV